MFKFVCSGVALAFLIAPSAHAASVIDSYSGTLDVREPFNMQSVVRNSEGGRFTVSWNFSRDLELFDEDEADNVNISLIFLRIDRIDYPFGDYAKDVTEYAESRMITKSKGSFSITLPTPVFSFDENNPEYFEDDNYFSLTYQLFSTKIDGMVVVEPVDYQISLTRTAIPEPATWALLVVGFGVVGAGLRKRTALSNRADASGGLQSRHI